LELTAGVVEIGIEKRPDDLPETRESAELNPISRIGRSLRDVERFRPRDDRALLPKDYQVPPGTDENVMGDVRDDDGVDYDTYMASDQELEDASRVWRRAIRNKMIEKSEKPGG